MVANGRSRFRVAGFKRGEEGLCLAAEMIEIGTGRKVLTHDRFSM
jgi:hypothetical protein